jgi:hypothetical protein
MLLRKGILIGINQINLGQIHKKILCWTSCLAHNLVWAETNATRTTLNGAKTYKLGTKQGCRDLNKINHRSGGLADKFCKTL